MELSYRTKWLSVIALTTATLLVLTNLPLNLTKTLLFASGSIASLDAAYATPGLYRGADVIGYARSPDLADLPSKIDADLLTSQDSDEASVVKRLFGLKNRRIYKQCKEKGTIYQSWLTNPDCVPSDKKVTQFKNYDDLQTWGWMMAERNSAYDGSHVAGLEKIVGTQSPGVINKGRQRTVAHTEQRTIDGVVYPATHGYYSNVYYPATGVILALDNYSPKKFVENRMKEEQDYHWDADNPWPKLQQWSDVTFLYWQALCERDNNPQELLGLKYIYRHTIMNANTTLVLQKVLKDKYKVKNGQVPAGSDGVTIKAGEPGFDAVLGTPNVVGVIWLLLQHVELGKKSIASFTIINDNKVGSKAPYAPCLIIELASIEDSASGQGGNRKMAAKL